MRSADNLPFAEATRAKLGDTLYRYLLGGARDAGGADGDANAAALRRYRLLPRLLTGLEGVDTGVSLWGHRFGAPLAVGAFAGDRVFHADGLLPVAAVCRRLALPLIVSEETVTPLAEITAIHDACWLQLRGAGPLERVVRLLDMAVESGAMGVIFTALAPTHPAPDMQPGGFSISEEIAARGWSTIGAAAGVEALPTFPAWSAETFTEVCRLADMRGLPVLLKGVLRGEDAALAEACGASGVIVSNIGLRQSARWALGVDRLASIRAATSLPVALDGGVRSGTDALIARCLGADVSLAARPVLSALAAGGEEAVASLLTSWCDDILAMLTWCGVDGVDALGPDFLASSPSEEPS
ncbi:alpha-hydroxy acid oxidase [Salinicola avicenniae]|uniref:alpha-hydroxy acid oxidase n=1 Tax=Salinicola avicenniae TaxID=2916836 RepID=UPI00207438CB|nr:MULTISPECIES: alpha-hydroxy acid oxidase [unclassified Salinicola]